jgi:hypothetical protein
MTMPFERAATCGAAVCFHVLEHSARSAAERAAPEVSHCGPARHVRAALLRLD